MTNTDQKTEDYIRTKEEKLTVCTTGRVGLDDGCDETLGTRDGSKEGFVDGRLLGRPVRLGRKDGKDVGLSDELGPALGCNDGTPLALGLREGVDDGMPEVVGYALGCEVGELETLGFSETADDGDPDVDGDSEGRVVGRSDTDGFIDG